jgi:hypothetical protein
MTCNVSQRICNIGETYLVKEERALILPANTWLVLNTSP